MPTNIPLPERLRGEMRFDMNQDKIDRINELARKQKNQGLSESEKAEQLALRREYIEAYKKSLMDQLDSLYYVEADGTKRKAVKKK